MPCHEISETFDFARRLHHAYTCGRGGDLRQSARDGEDKIGASDISYRREDSSAMFSESSILAPR